MRSKPCGKVLERTVHGRNGWIFFTCGEHGLRMSASEGQAAKWIEQVYTGPPTCDALLDSN